ncbi:hypothetical protein FJZ19_01195 [Candidatus Pacearchaeota archaeon]|nr:hypothetical protein [Candidatus Pacearchaeota archaeon]
MSYISFFSADKKEDLSDKVRNTPLDTKSKRLVALMMKASFEAGINIKHMDADAPASRMMQKRDYERAIEALAKKLVPNLRELAQRLTQFSYDRGFNEENNTNINYLLRRMGCRQMPKAVYS